MESKVTAAASATTVSSIAAEAGDAAAVAVSAEVVATVAASSARDSAADPTFCVKVHPGVRRSCLGDQTVVDCHQALSSLERRPRLQGVPVFLAFPPDTVPRCEEFRYQRPARTGTGGSPLTV